MTGTVERCVLQENSTTGEVVQLGGTQAAALEQSGLVEIRRLNADTVRLLPRGRVGAVQTEGLEVVVEPKLGISRLLFLLGYADDPGFRPESVTGAADDDLWPAIAETVCRHVEHALARGVLQGYASRDEALNMVRGRIRVGDQLARRPGLPLPLEVTYDEYTVDIAENRLLRAAIRRLLAVQNIRSDCRRRLQHLESRLDGVSRLVPGTSLPRWTQDRLNARYHSALQLAELVMRNLSFELGSGSVKVASFVVNMATVFEQFVVTALRRAWSSYPGDTRSQYWVPLDADHSIDMYVDAVHLVEREPRVIVDAKYKLTDATGSHANADHYQMLAYCTALGLDTAWLVYASGPKSVERSIRNSPVRVIEYPLDLEVPPADLLRQIEQLAVKAFWGTREATIDPSLLSHAR